MGRYEIQVLESLREPRLTPTDRRRPSTAQWPPLVNASRPQGEWNVYDIVFEAPRFEGEKLAKPGYITVIHNGVLVHHRKETPGTRHPPARRDVRAARRGGTAQPAGSRATGPLPQHLDPPAQELRRAVNVPAPLDGIRVIDFGRFIAGPYCGMLLADMGADVIRIDRRQGSEDRYTGPVTEQGEGGAFISLNRNKRSLTLDLSKPRAGEIVERLAASADIVLANLPIAVLRKNGLDYDSLRAVNPRIILARVSTFGPDGPYAHRVGFDTIAQAMSGAMSLTGFPETPVRAQVPFEDYGTALHAAFGILAALLNRERTGEGQVVERFLVRHGRDIHAGVPRRKGCYRCAADATGERRFLHRANGHLPHARRLDRGAGDRLRYVRALGSAGGPRGLVRRQPVCRRSGSRRSS